MRNRQSLSNLTGRLRVSGWAVGLAASLLAVTGCDRFAGSETITLEIFPVEVRVKGPPGANVGGIPVTFSHADRLVTNPKGRLRVNYQGEAGGTLNVAVQLPKSLRALSPVEQDFTLVHDAEGNPASVRFDVRVDLAPPSAAPDEPEQANGTKYVVVVDSECQGQQVEVDDEVIGLTDVDGYLEKNVVRTAGGQATVVAKPKGQCGEIRCVFALPKTGAILNVQPGCNTGDAAAVDDMALPEGDAVAEAPPPPQRERTARRPSGRKPTKARAKRKPAVLASGEPEPLKLPNDDLAEPVAASKAARRVRPPSPPTTPDPPPLAGPAR